ncbi:MAG: hypothetical protein P8099_15435 [Gemmatimonadota bacterium]|jgi:hypothetical protein
MADNKKPERSQRSISRHDLERVIRRASELAASADADERIPESEVVQIAAELGLSARHVRQALLEVPGSDEPGPIDRLYGPDIVMAARSVPGDPEALLRMLEDYLATREYLQVVRRREGLAAFVQADDTVSKVARALRRPRRRFHIARARSVIVRARELEQGVSHVRLDVNVKDRRRRAIRNGVLATAFVSAPLGAAVFVPVWQLVASVAGDPLGIAAGAITGVGALGLGLAGGITLSGMRFRRKLAAVKLELQGLLDRLQRGDRLDPPPSPLMRRLRQSTKRMSS